MRLPQPNHAYALLWEALTGEKRGADAAAREDGKRACYINTTLILREVEN